MVKNERSFPMEAKDVARVRGLHAWLELLRVKIRAQLAGRMGFDLEAKGAELRSRLIATEDNIEIVRGCLDGEYGITQNRRDIVVRDKLDRDIGQLVARRTHLYVSPESKRPAPREAEMAMIAQELEVLGAARSRAYVRLFKAKRMHALLQAYECPHRDEAA